MFETRNIVVCNIHNLEKGERVQDCYLPSPHRNRVTQLQPWLSPYPGELLLSALQYTTFYLSTALKINLIPIIEPHTLHLSH